MTLAELARHWSERRSDDGVESLGSGPAFQDSGALLHLHPQTACCISSSYTLIFFFWDERFASVVCILLICFIFPEACFRWSYWSLSCDMKRKLECVL